MRSPHTLPSCSRVLHFSGQHWGGEALGGRVISEGSRGRHCFALNRMPRALSDKDTARLKRQILENTAEIIRLKARIKKSFRDRGKSPAKRHEWEQACAEFHARYDGLAFPSGYQGGGVLNRISYGDREAMEAAICFLEIRAVLLPLKLHVQGYFAPLQASAVARAFDIPSERKKEKRLRVSITIGLTATIEEWWFLYSTT
jgi:hypothetical protein